MRVSPYLSICLLAAGTTLRAQQTVVTPATVPPTTAVTAPTPKTGVTAGPDANGRCTLRDGDDVPLKFAQDLSSKTAAEGDEVMFTLDEDLKAGGVVVAKAGCKAVGEVTNSRSPA